ncbi:MAG: hypothetical protein PF508_07790 [Spirochaeta sp.]|nr:hypothetical protein [Spirochaeta sp.]
MSVFTHVSSHLRRSLFFLGSRKLNAERSAMPLLLTVLLVAGSLGLLGGC